ISFSRNWAKKHYKRGFRDRNKTKISCLTERGKPNDIAHGPISVFKFLLDWYRARTVPIPGGSPLELSNINKYPTNTSITLSANSTAPLKYSTSTLTERGELAWC